MPFEPTSCEKPPSGTRALPVVNWRNWARSAWEKDRSARQSQTISGSLLRQPCSWTEFLSCRGGPGQGRSVRGRASGQDDRTDLVNVDRRQSRDEQLELARVVDLEQGLGDDPKEGREKGQRCASQQ